MKSEPNLFMKEAILEALEGITHNHGGPFGCVIVKDGKIVGRGHNMVIKNKDPTAHAEMMAIRDSCRNLDTFDLSGCEIYTTGEPCPMCLGAILWSHIETVYFGCNTNDAEKIGFSDKEYYESMNNNLKWLMIDHEACLGLYDKYANLPNKTMY